MDGFIAAVGHTMVVGSSKVRFVVVNWGEREEEREEKREEEGKEEGEKEREEGRGEGEEKREKQK